MGKRLPITQDIADRLAKCYGAPVANPSSYAVFEAVSLNTQPLRRASGFFEAAMISAETVVEMAAMVNAGPIPLQTMHEDQSLPVGRVFHATTRLDQTGQPELLLQFFVANSEPKLIADLDQGVINEVSVSFMPKAACCSACGFDYLGNEADFINHLTLTCPDNHVIGTDGVHVKLNGVKSFNELSLVGRGAAQGTSILPVETSQPYALAASIGNNRVLSLRLNCAIEGTAMTTPPTPPAPVPAPAAPSFAEVLTLSQNFGELKATHAQVVAENVSLKSTNTALETQVAELSVFKAQAGELTTLKAAHEVALAHLKDAYKAVSVALGNLNPTIPDDVTLLIAGCKAAGPNLALIYREGGHNLQAGITDADKSQSGISSSFRVPTHR